MVLTSSKAGAIIGIIGGTISLISGLFFMQLTQMYSIDGRTIFRIIGSAVTILIGCFAILGSVASFKGKFFGYKLLILVGLFGIAGTFIPITNYDTGYSIQIFYLSSTAMYIDVVLITVGGILGIALKENNRRS